MSLSALQAAQALGVSRMQISRLVRQGDLRASRLGNALLIDPDSVSAYRDLRPEPGRPLSPHAAWERIEAESALLASLMSDRKALAAARQLAIVARRRAERRPYRALPNRLPALLGDDRFVLSGADAGQHHGAPVRPGQPHLLYVSSDNLEHVIADHRLSASGEPNVIVRAVNPDAWILEHRVAPRLVAAIDAIEEGDTRSAAEIVRHALSARGHAVSTPVANVGQLTKQGRATWDAIAELAERVPIDEWLVVGGLIDRGEIAASLFGGAWAINRDSVYRYRDLRPVRGRTHSPDGAWRAIRHAALHSLDEAHQLAIASRRRAERVGALVPLDRVDALIADPRVVESGVGAAARLGATVDARPPFRSTCGSRELRPSDWRDIERKYRIDRAHSEQNIMFGVAADRSLDDVERLPRAVVLIDLVAERENRAATQAGVTDESSGLERRALSLDDCREGFRTNLHFRNIPFVSER